MADTGKILTSLHGRSIGIDREGNLVVEGNVAVTATRDASGNVTGLSGTATEVFKYSTANTPAQNAAAINARLAVNGYCELPVGVVEIDSPIKMPSNSVLIGHGRGITTIKLADGSDCCAIQNINVVDVATIPSSGQENIHIANLTIDGNVAGQSGLAAAHAANENDGIIHGVFLGRVANTSIKDVEIKNVDGTGLFIRGWDQVTSSFVHQLHNIYAHDNELTGRANIKCSTISYSNVVIGKR